MLFIITSQISQYKYKEFTRKYENINICIPLSFNETEEIIKDIKKYKNSKIMVGVSSIIKNPYLRPFIKKIILDCQECPISFFHEDSNIPVDFENLAIKLLFDKHLKPNSLMDIKKTNQRVTILEFAFSFFLKNYYRFIRKKRMSKKEALNIFIKKYYIFDKHLKPNSLMDIKKTNQRVTILEFAFSFFLKNYYRFIRKKRMSKKEALNIFIKKYYNRISQYNQKKYLLIYLDDLSKYSFTETFKKMYTIINIKEKIPRKIKIQISNKNSILLIESIWETTKIAEKNNFFLIKRSIPLIFWNKEDPKHFFHFYHYPILKYSNLILTTGNSVLDFYKQYYRKPAQYMPFHNSFSVTNHIKYPLLKENNNKAVFFGSLYSNHFFRQKKFLLIIKELKILGFQTDLFIRNIENKSMEMYKEDFDYYHQDIKNTEILCPEDVSKEMQNYTFVINSSIEQADLYLFPRRITELLALKKIIISSYSISLDYHFGDIISFIKEKNNNINKKELFNTQKIKNKQEIGLRLALLKYNFKTEWLNKISQVQPSFNKKKNFNKNIQIIYHLKREDKLKKVIKYLENIYFNQIKKPIITVIIPKTLYKQKYSYLETPIFFFIEENYNITTDLIFYGDISYTYPAFYFLDIFLYSQGIFEHTKVLEIFYKETKSYLIPNRELENFYKGTTQNIPLNLNTHF